MSQAGRVAVERLVTIDGPAGSGKTTLGRRLAQALDLPLVDTGLFYRGVTAAAVLGGLDGSDAAALGELARHVELEINTDPRAPDGAWQLRLDGEDVTAEIRDPARAPLLARISGVREVREALREKQRRAAAAGAVAVGRDCGTVVFPWAPLKLYLDAPGPLRTGRRDQQLRGGGTPVDVAGLRAEVSDRDALDSGRPESPLRPAEDAHMIDTGRLGIEEMVTEAMRLCRDVGLLAPAGE
ncbi:MAG: (d)CMP kinase [Chloroflexi bacterium]|nr:MAG: (d)CMP kinase [Chloroflexota bacterium]